MAPSRVFFGLPLNQPWHVTQHAYHGGNAAPDTPRWVPPRAQAVIVVEVAVKSMTLAPATAAFCTAMETKVAATAAMSTVEVRLDRGD